MTSAPVVNWPQRIFFVINETKGAPFIAITTSLSGFMGFYRVLASGAVLLLSVKLAEKI